LRVGHGANPNPKKCAVTETSESVEEAKTHIGLWRQQRRRRSKWPALSLFRTKFVAQLPTKHVIL
jgi:hypothetical protein